MAGFEWSDTEMLECLHLVDQCGLTRLAAGQKLGRSKGSVIGMLDRVRKESAQQFPPDTNDGTMPPRWWAR